jgi:hypothetical protein
MADVILHRPAFPGGKMLRSQRKGLAFTSTSTTNSYTLQCNGQTNMVLVEMPNFTNAITATLTVSDENGVTIMTKAAIAENANTMLDATDDFDKAMAGTYTVLITLSGAAGGTGGTVYTTFYLI